MIELDTFPNEKAVAKSMRLARKLESDETEQLAELFYERAKPHLADLDATPTNLEDAARRLRAYHALGVVTIEVVGDRSEYGSKSMGKLAVRIGRKANWLAKVREFAESYNQRDLRDLCKRADRLSWGHLTHLLFISDPQQRLEFQERAASENWTAEKLRLEIRKSIPKANKGGRKPKLPKDPNEALEQIVEDSRWWLKRLEAAMSVVGSNKTGKSGKATKTLVIEASEVLGELARRAAKTAKEVAGGSATGSRGKEPKG